MNMDIQINDRERQFTLVYSLMEAERERRAKEFGKRLTSCMEALKVKPDTLAPHIGCSRGVLYKWMNGETARLDYFLLEDLAESLYTTSRWLALGEGPSPLYLNRPEISPPIGPRKRLGRT